MAKLERSKLPRFTTHALGSHVLCGGDVLGSIDLGDVVTLINGRSELVAELSAASAELRSYVAAEMARVSEDAYWDYLVQDVARGYGEVAAARADVIRERIASISE